MVGVFFSFRINKHCSEHTISQYNYGQYTIVEFMQMERNKVWKENDERRSEWAIFRERGGGRNEARWSERKPKSLTGLIKQDQKCMINGRQMYVRIHWCVSFGWKPMTIYQQIHTKINIEFRMKSDLLTITYTQIVWKTSWIDIGVFEVTCWSNSK